MTPISITEADGNRQAPAGPSRARRWLFRLAAVVMGLSPLAMVEGICILIDWGRPSVHDDPFVGFRSVRPLFVLNEDGTRYEIPPARQSYFRPETFAAMKPEDEFRIFFLGGSTVQGRPFATETSFTTWLEISLNAAQPEGRYDVINCGGVSYASYRLVPILDEVLRHEPDLIVVYTGHNEFLEDRTYDHLKNRGAILDGALAVASRLRTFTLLREGYLRLGGRSSREPPPDRPLLPSEVEALLDYRGGLEAYHQDAAWREGVIDHYRFNLRRLVQMARDAGVKMILINPASNVAHTPPFKSEHGADLAADALDRWNALAAEARDALDRGNLRRYAALLEERARIDPLYAGTHYNLGKCYEELGQIDRAREAYVRAKECDVCPLRILQPMNDAVLDIAQETGTPLVDAQALFERHSRHGIVGRQWLVDHVHPTIEGHKLLATELARKLVAMGLVSPRPGWEARKDRRYGEHRRSLDALYFAKGEQRLENLRLWSQGRSERIRPTAGE